MKIAKRRGAWYVDAYIHGRRVVKRFRTRRRAEDELSKLNEERKQRTVPKADPFVIFKDYVPRFVRDCVDAEVAPATLVRYQQALETHILPAFGSMKIRDVTRSDVRTFLQSKRQDGNIQGQRGKDRTPRKGLSKATVNQVRSVLSAVLSLAVDDEVIRFNPALSIGRHTKRTRAAKVRDRVTVNVKAMDREQRNRFLAAAAVHESEHYPAFLIGALAGLRRDEILALRWASVDLVERKIRVHEQLLIGLTKSGDERQVDMAAPLVAVLRSVLARRREESMAAGQGGDVSPYVVLPWLSDRPTAQQAQRARKRLIRAMRRCLKIAGLPLHFTPHSLRHTFCVHLISEGVSPVYVQQQAGHANVEMTVRVYGSWFPTTVPGAMDRLAEGVTVTFQAQTGNISPEPESQVLPPTGTCGSGNASRPFPA